MVALRVSLSMSLSNNALPYQRVCDKEELVNSSVLQSVFFIVLGRMYLSSLNRTFKEEVWGRFDIQTSTKNWI